MLLDIAALVEHAASWLLRGNRLDLTREIGRFRPAIQQLGELLAGLLPATDQAIAEARTARLTTHGVPDRLARIIGQTIFLTSALEIAELAERTAQRLEPAARVYYQAGAKFALDEMRAAALRLPTETSWQKQAVETVIDDLFAIQGELATRVLQSRLDGDDPLAAWTAQRGGALAPAEALAAELRSATTPDLAMLVVAGRQLRQALQ
jgi:glutamate dehydrogenase